MKNLNIKFDLASAVAFIQKRFSLILWILLALLFLVEAWVIKSSVDKFLTANDQSVFSSVQLVKLNTDQYDKIEKRLSENELYLPEEPRVQDPFGVPKESQ